MVLVSSLSYISLSIAILIVVAGWRPRIARYWKAIYWGSLLNLFVGLWMDATIPTDINAANNASFWGTALAVVVALVPAYFFSYAVAYKQGTNSIPSRETD